jgi:hypothetical protein
MKKNKLSLIVLLLLAIAAYYLFSKKNTNVSSRSLTEFAIEDTASITKIFLADNDGNHSLLKKMPDGTWMVNDKFKARPQNIFLILRGLKNLEVKSTVPKEGIPAIIKQIAAKPIKVEVYQGGDKPTKTYYFGYATQDHYGNYALLELPGEGKSKEPFIVKEKGFYGFFRPRLITNEAEWRSQEIFYYPELDISTIKVEYPGIPEASFSIDWKGRNNISLMNDKGDRLSHFDTLAVKNYMLLYKAIYLETYNNRLNTNQLDSIINQNSPKAIISVKDNDDNITRVELYTKGFIDPILRKEEFGNLDPERLYILTESNELALGQKLQWDPLLIPLETFNVE